MPAQPEPFRAGEAGHRDDTEGARERRIGGELLRFLAGATVVPEDRRAQGPILRVEEDGGVHLARETDGRDAGKVRRRRLPQGGDGRLDRFPPALRILLRPERLRPLDAQRHLCLGEHRLRAVDEDRLHRGRADIDAEKGAHAWVR